MNNNYDQNRRLYGKFTGLTLDGSRHACKFTDLLNCSWVFSIGVNLTRSWRAQQYKELDLCFIGTIFAFLKLFRNIILPLRMIFFRRSEVLKSKCSMIVPNGNPHLINFRRYSLTDSSVIRPCLVLILYRQGFFFYKVKSNFLPSKLKLLLDRVLRT